MKSKNFAWGFALVGVCIVGILTIKATSPAQPRGIPKDAPDPEVMLIGPASSSPSQLQRPTPNMNGGIPISFTSIQKNGFALRAPGGILQVHNDTGSPITTLNLVMTGTIGAHSPDTTGVLTCNWNPDERFFNLCTETVPTPLPNFATSGGNGFASFYKPGPPPWTLTWTGGTIPADAYFDLSFGSFNHNDDLIVTLSGSTGSTGCTGPKC